MSHLCMRLYAYGLGVESGYKYMENHEHDHADPYVSLILIVSPPDHPSDFVMFRALQLSLPARHQVHIPTPPHVFSRLFPNPLFLLIVHTHL